MIGQQLGPYTIDTELGCGGMGRVFKATGPEGAVALKIVHPHLLETEGFFKRFLREAEIGQRVAHQNVVRTLDCDALGGHHYLVMEYVEGQTLRDLLRELGRVPEELCRHVGREVARGLAAIHEAGVIHRDLKPENVLITPDHMVKVMDLGVARLKDEALRLSQAGDFVGSFEYAAPEQFPAAEGEPDGRADLYALGVVLYELATGRHPHRDEDPWKQIGHILNDEPRRAGEVNPQLSPFLEEVIHTLLAKQREQRFADAAALATVLDEGEESGWWSDRVRALRQETKRPLRRVRVPRETALYGRDDDLARLHALFDDVRAGDGRVLLIEGEAGIGKTRLVDEFVGRLRQAGEDVNFLFGSYPPGGAATAAGAFSEAYREQFGAEGLEEALANYLTVTPLLIPAFAALLKGDASPTGAEPLTKDSLQTVFVHATRGLAAERPTVVLIDDLHFAPEDGRALFASLALAAPGHRILLLGTMRPGVPEDWIADVERQEHASRIALHRLGPKDLFRLLQDSFRSERLANEVAGRIAVKSDGNPFFAFEIIRGLREGRFISRQADGTWVTTRQIDEILVPSSVLDLVNARVAELSEPERDLLDVAACCGFQFDPSLVGEVTGLPRIATLKRLGQIERRHRLVRSVGRSYVFDHHQVQEALYGAQNRQLREEYHAAIAEALEARENAADSLPEDLDGALCVDLCEHFLKGARGDRALRYLDAALGYLWKDDQAIALADLALAVPQLLRGRDRLEVLLGKNARLGLLGRRQDQEAVLAEGQAVADEMDDRPAAVRVMRARGTLLWRTGHNEQARVHFERSLAVAREIGDRRAEGTAIADLGIVSFALGRHEQAREQLERALAIAREAGDRQGAANATGNLGNVLRALDRYEEAREHFERSATIARELGNRWSESINTGNLGSVFLSLGRYEEARQHYERHLALVREIGDRYGEGVATGNLGNVFIALGRHEEARAHYERSAEIVHEIGDRQGEGIAIGNLGVVAFALGRHADARAHYERALAIAREVGDRQGEANATGNLGSVFRELGRCDEARARLERHLAIAREIGDRRGEAYALSGLSSVAHEEGDGARALELASDALRLHREISHGKALADSLIQMGDLRWQAGDDDGAREALTEAVDLLRRQRREGELAHALALLACAAGGDVHAAEEALRSAGEGNHALATRYHLWKATGDQVHLAQAKRLLDYRVDHAPEEDRESMVGNVRLHREIMEAWEARGTNG